VCACVCVCVCGCVRVHVRACVSNLMHLNKQVNLADDPEILGQFSAEEMTGRCVGCQNSLGILVNLYMDMF